MPDPHRISVTLPDDLAAAVARKVESGEYASAGEVLLKGVRAVLERDARNDDAPAHHGEAFERWLREEVVPGHAEYVADPSTGIPPPAANVRQPRHAARRYHARGANNGVRAQRHHHFTVADDAVIIEGVFYGGQDVAAAFNPRS